MPTYSFQNKVTGETFDKFMTISAREQYLKNNPDIQPVLTAPGISYDSQGLSGAKPDEGFRDLLRNMQNKAIGGKYLQSKYI